MIETTQKVIKIGSSGGITLPAKELKRQGINIGDEVKVTIEPVVPTHQDQLMGDYDSFVKEYGETLKNLADR